MLSFLYGKIILKKFLFQYMFLAWAVKGATHFLKQGGKINLGSHFSVVLVHTQYTDPCFLVTQDSLPGHAWKKWKIKTDPSSLHLWPSACDLKPWVCLYQFRASPSRSLALHPLPLSLLQLLSSMISCLYSAATTITLFNLLSALLGL